jgi:hypothetical protein
MKSLHIDKALNHFLPSYMAKADQAGKTFIPKKLILCFTTPKILACHSCIGYASALCGC